MLLPAFVESRHGCQGQLEVQGNTNELVLHNSGDAHLQLHQATLVDGEQRWPISLPKVGYLLGGSQYRWPLPAGGIVLCGCFIWRPPSRLAPQACSP